MQLKPSPRCPALQYLDDVDPGGVADLAGLQAGDFLLAVSSLCVRDCPDTKLKKHHLVSEQPQSQLRKFLTIISFSR